MRRAVLMTRQAISPRLAIRIRLNIFLTAAFGRDPEPQTGTQGTGVTIPSYSKTEQRQRLICRKSACQGRYSCAAPSGLAAGAACLIRPDRLPCGGVPAKQHSPKASFRKRIQPNGAACAFCTAKRRPGRTPLSTRIRIQDNRGGTYRSYPGIAVTAIPVRRLRRKTAGCFVRLPLRLHRKETSRSRAASGMAYIDYQVRGKVRRPAARIRPASSMYRVRCRRGHWMAPRQTAFRQDLRVVAGGFLQVSVSPSRRRQMAAFHVHRRTAFTLHDARRIQANLAAQHPRGGAAPILDHLPDHEIEDAGLGVFGGRIIVGPACGWPT